MKMIILDLDRICRLCLAQGENMVPIFEHGCTLSGRIENCTYLKLSSSDGLPNLLCVECLSKLDLIEGFRDQCERSDSILREYVQVKGANNEQLEENTNRRRDMKCKEEKEKRGKSGKSNGNCKVTGTELLFDSSEEDDTFWAQVEEDASETAPESSSIFLKQEFVPVGKDGAPQVSLRSQSSIKKEKTSNSSLPNNEHTEENSELAVNGNHEEPNQKNPSEISEKQKISRSKSKSKPRTRKAHSYECEYCGRTFPRSNHLAQHEVTHTKEKPFQCSYCQKSFWYKNSLIGHIKQNHTGDVNYTCEECGRGFFQKSEYMRHKPIHSDETPFKCEECDMCFKLLKNLKRHQKVHTGTRTHTCQYCGKSFRMLQTLRVHLVLHSGEKPYKCKHCGRGFSQSAPLKAHIRTHTGEKPYVCNTCGEGFPTGNSLKAHVFKHTGIHPNSCKDCSLVFKRKRDLVSHWNNIHGGTATEPLKVPPQLPPEAMDCPLPGVLEKPQQPQIVQISVNPHSLPQATLPVPTPPAQQPAEFGGMQELIIGSLDSLDDDSLSDDPQSHHQILLNPLPSVLEISHSMSEHLLSSSLGKSDPEDLLSSDSLSFS